MTGAPVSFPPQSPEMHQRNSQNVSVSGVNNALTSLSMAEKIYILEGCRDNCRMDGRTRTSLRPISLVTGGNGPLVLSHGSSRIVSTHTEILCSVKADLVCPSADAPNLGMIDIHVDMMVGSTVMTASDTRNSDSRQRRNKEQQLEASLKLLLQDTLVSLSSLCAIPNHYVWRLCCDLLFLRASGGSVADYASRALRGALMNAKLPIIVPISSSLPSTTQSLPTEVSQRPSTATLRQLDYSVDSDIQKARSVLDEMDINYGPIIITVALCKCPPQQTIVWILDPTREEEECASCLIRAAVTPSGSVVSIDMVQGSLPVHLLPAVTQAVVQASQQVFANLESSRSKMTSSTLTMMGSDQSHFTLLQPQFLIR
jgi:exosome complex component RRP42